MATEYKLPFTAAEIRERLEKVNKLVSTVNGVAPDANGNIEIESGGASSWNDLADKPFGENTIIIGDTFTWDGNINDRAYVKTFIEGAAAYSVHVSDIVPSNEEIKKGGYYFINGNPIPYTVDDVLAHDDGKSASIVSGSLFFVVFAREDNLVLHSPLGDMRFPKKGMYFGSSPDMNLLVTGLSINDYIFTETEIKPLDIKYLPESHQFGETTVMGDTITWNGNTEGHELAMHTLPTEYGVDICHISDVIPTLADLQNGGIITWGNGNASKFTVDNIIDLGGGVLFEINFNFAIVLEDNATATAPYEGIMVTSTFPKKGIYFTKMNGYTASLKINGFNKFLINEIKPIDTKYLPESHQFGETITTTTKEAIIWDGNTDKRHNLMGMLYHISSSVPTLADLQNGGTIIFANFSGEEHAIDFTAEDIIDGEASDMGIGCIAIDSDTILPILIAMNDNSVIRAGDGRYMSFEKAGIYFPYMFGDGINFYAKSFTINNYTFVENITAVDTIDIKYLPEQLQISGTVAEADAITWDGNTTGLYNLMGYLYHVSSATPTLTDLQNGGTIDITTGSQSESLSFTNENVFDIQSLGDGKDLIFIQGDFGLVLIALQDGAYMEEDGVKIVFEKAGTYFMYDVEGNNYTSSFTINNYIFTISTVKKLDKMYLPPIEASDLNIFENEYTDTIYTANVSDEIIHTFSLYDGRLALVRITDIVDNELFQNSYVITDRIDGTRLMCTPNDYTPFFGIDGLYAWTTGFDGVYDAIVVLENIETEVGNFKKGIYVRNDVKSLTIKDCKIFPKTHLKSNLIETGDFILTEDTASGGDTLYNNGVNDVMPLLTSTITVTMDDLQQGVSVYACIDSNVGYQMFEFPTAKNTIVERSDGNIWLYANNNTNYPLVIFTSNGTYFARRNGNSSSTYGCVDYMTIKGFTGFPIKGKKVINPKYLSEASATFILQTNVVGTFNNATASCTKSFEQLTNMSLDELYGVKILSDCANTNLIAKPVTVIKTSNAIYIGFISVNYLMLGIYYIKCSEDGFIIGNGLATS